VSFGSFIIDTTVLVIFAPLKTAEPIGTAKPEVLVAELRIG
jgi:hypothetical protein